MKEIMDAIIEAGQDDIKKGAGLGAGVGLTLSVTKDAGSGEMLKNAAIGAGAGALFAWVLKEFNSPTSQQEKTIANLPEHSSVDSEDAQNEYLVPSVDEK